MKENDCKTANGQYLGVKHVSNIVEYGCYQVQVEAVGNLTKGQISKSACSVTRAVRVKHDINAE